MTSDGEVHEDDDELHAWCLLEERENVQWQEVMSDFESEEDCGSERQVGEKVQSHQ